MNDLLQPSSSFAMTGDVFCYIHSTALTGVVVRTIQRSKHRQQGAATTHWGCCNMEQQQWELQPIDGNRSATERLQGVGVQAARRPLPSPEPHTAEGVADSEAGYQTVSGNGIGRLLSGRPNFGPAKSGGTSCRTNLCFSPREKMKVLPKHSRIFVYMAV